MFVVCSGLDILAKFMKHEIPVNAKVKGVYQINLK